MGIPPFTHYRSIYSTTQIVFLHILSRNRFLNPFSEVQSCCSMLTTSTFTAVYVHFSVYSNLVFSIQIQSSTTFCVCVFVLFVIKTCYSLGNKVITFMLFTHTYFSACISFLQFISYFENCSVLSLEKKKDNRNHREKKKKSCMGSQQIIFSNLQGWLQG